MEIAKSAYERAKASYEAAANNFKLASLDAQDLVDESTAELEKNISDIEEKMYEQPRGSILIISHQERILNIADKIVVIKNGQVEKEGARADILPALLGSADLPLEGLSVEDGELLYNGHKWDSISGAEQLIVATSIVRKLNPDCGFVLLDKLEQMDTDTLEDFGKWLEAQGLQAIATRVSTGDECSIIIEDGRSMDNDKEENTETKTWKAGAF